MSDEDEDDYLSDKFLIETQAASSTASKTYSQLRKDAEKKAKLKNEENKLKSRREREIEAREEGLSKSLFAKAKEEEQEGGPSNKALSIMMKMGFVPGQSLGRPRDGDSNDDPERLKSETSSPPPSQTTAQYPGSKDSDSAPTGATDRLAKSEDTHRTEPLPLNEWAGRQGIGNSRKRVLSPTGKERIAKMAKMAEDSSKEDFRDRARREYEERRAEGRLGPAQRTCATLDEKAGKPFNVLWLNPRNADTFPPGLMETLSLHTTLDTSFNQEHQDDNLETRLQRQMKSDALQPGSHEVYDIDDSVNTEFSQDTLEEIVQFLRLQAQDRLELVITYLRDHYAYCFWCGAQYDDQENMTKSCPGITEAEHD